VLIYQDKENPEYMFHVEISEDEQYIFLYILKDSSRVNLSKISAFCPINDACTLLQQNLLRVAKFDPNNIGPDIKWNKIADEWGAEYDAYDLFTYYAQHLVQFISQGLQPKEHLFIFEQITTLHNTRSSLLMSLKTTKLKNSYRKVMRIYPVFSV
jgi:hypothetical protein